MSQTLTSSLSYVSLGCNRIASCGDWALNSELFAFTGGNLVALYEPQRLNKILVTLKGHKERANTVRFISPITDDDDGLTMETELVSCGVDSQIIVWKLQLLISKGDNKVIGIENYEISQCLGNYHKGSITDVRPLVDQKNKITYLASTAEDGTVCIFERGNTSEKFELLGKLHFGNKMMETVSLFFLPHTQTLGVALGGLDNQLHIYIRSDTQKTESSFLKVCSLQGHQSWIKSIAACTCDDGNVLLASASQDSKIRLWKITKAYADSNMETFCTQTDKFIEEQLKLIQKEEESKNRSDNGDLESIERTSQSSSLSLSRSSHLIQLNDDKWTITFDALLTGHSDWVHSVSWHPPHYTGNKEVNNGFHQPLKLISASMDRTMMIWSPEKTVGMWINEVSMGEFGGLSGLFGQMGFFGAYFNRSGSSVISHGYNGSFHYWNYNTGKQDWEPRVSISGHFGPVMDCSWDPKYNYFISVSTDQTTRLFSHWARSNTWHEIARPQIHGYDLNCFTFLQSREHTIVSGADEKVLRVFEGPQSFVDSLKNISGVISTEVSRPASASVPALGLSNKAIEEGGQDIFIKDEFDTDEFNSDTHATSFKLVTLEEPPLEEQLLQNTLWPEIQKLYGHPNELLSVCGNFSGTVIASACVAKKENAAQVRLWGPQQNWNEIDVIAGHGSSVACITFSHNDKYMISVSKDRNIILYEKTQNGDFTTYKIVGQDTGHKRIIWSASFSFDSLFFATGSRDETVKIWRAETVEVTKKSLKGALTTKKTFPLMCTLSFKGRPVTAVEFIPKVAQQQIESRFNYLLAVGFECGSIELYAPSSNDADLNTMCKQFVCVDKLKHNDCHTKTVRRLRFRWLQNTGNHPTLQLLSCSTDHSIRLFDITI